MSSIVPFSRPEPADATGALLDLLGPIDAPAALPPYARQRLSQAGLTAGPTLAIDGGAASLADIPLYGRLELCVGP